jgi:hypothetical protein
MIAMSGMVRWISSMAALPVMSRRHNQWESSIRKPVR